MSTQTPECFLCMEKYTSKVRIRIMCCFCDQEACRPCWERFILSKSSEPFCMNHSCKKQFDQKWIEENFPKSFWSSRLRKHRQEMMLAREKSYLPQAQVRVEEKKALNHYKGALTDLDRRIKDLRREIDRLKETKRAMRDEWVAREGGALPPGEKKKKVVLMQRCADGDHCRGFVGQDWVCGLCQKKTCRRCLQLDNSTPDCNHECREDDLATAKELRANTKPCPKCGVRIHKISGCPQMWCPSCHVAFDWNTLEIDKGRVHNPEFFRWQREHGAAPREAGDLPCGGLPPYFRKVKGLNKEQVGQLNNALRGVIHVSANIVQNLRPQPPDNEDLRVRYLMEEIDEKAWKVALTRRERAYLKKLRFYECYEFMVLAGTDILQRAHAQINTQNGASPMLDELTELRHQVNNMMASVSARFNQCAYNRFLDDWSSILIKNKKTVRRPKNPKPALR